MEQGTAESLRHIAHGSMNPLDYIGVALWFTPIAGMRKGTEMKGREVKGTEESRGGERETAKDENVKNARTEEVNAGENIGDSGSAFERGDMAPENVKSFEQSIRSEPIENGQFFDKDGNAIGDRFIGNESSIDISSGKDIAKDAIFTHNHPNNGIFSPADLTTASNFNMAEIRATTNNGTYSAKRGPNGWGQPPKSPMEMNNLFKEVQNEMRNDPEMQSLYREKGPGAVNEIMIGRVIERLGGIFKKY